MLKISKFAPIKSLIGRVSQIELPQRLRGGAVEKTVNYLRNVFLDYQAVYRDTRQDMRDRPLRSSIIGGVLLGLGYLAQTNPSQEQFLEQLVTYNNNVSRVPESIRNADSFRHIDQVFLLNDQQVLRHQSLGFFSVIYREDYPSGVDLFQAQCNYLRPSWKSYLTERIVDIGVLGKYQVMKYKMADYDVNKQEWSKPIEVPALQ